MKKTNSFENQCFKILKPLMVALFLQITTQTIQAQSSNNSSIPDTDKTGSKRARVLFFNDDESNSANENFFVSYGQQHNWWNNVKLEVQREGGVSSRSGMFMDWDNLTLVADWDNSSHNDPNTGNIIFGFDSNRKENIREKMRLTDLGKLGLGTQRPSGMFHIKHSSHMYEEAGFLMESSRSSSVFNFINSNDNLYLGFNSNSEENYPEASYLNRFFIGSNGNIGLGTTSPKGRLHVSGSAYIDGRTFAQGNVQLYAREGNAKSGTAYTQAKDYSNKTSIGLLLNSQNGGSAVNALKINPNGNVGVGTTTPSEKLDVQGNIKVGSGSNIYLQGGMLSDKKGLYLIADRDSNSNNEDIIFGFDGRSRESVQEKMRLTNKGYLGIGTNSPTEKLEVLGKIKASSFVTSLQSFPDYVFDPSYKKRSLASIEEYVSTHRHLPNMPSEKNVIDNGLDIPEVVTKSVENIEEIYLHLIELEKRLKELEKENAFLKATQKK